MKEFEKHSEISTGENKIVAISTPIGRGAISVVRMSGCGVIDIAKTMFKPFPAEAGMLKLGKLDAKHFSDQAMCVYFVAPKSYTGEDMVEFQVHGGFSVADGVLKSCIQNGCRLAERGEFTKRAYLNGKMNLAGVEGIMDVIDAESISAVENGYKMLTGRLDDKINNLQDSLTDLLAQIEVALDYPEEDLEYITKDKVFQTINKVLKEIIALSDTASKGRIIKNGVDIAIVGKTNVGKSSLLNALVGYDRAIVTDIEGTTRDTLSESYVYNDVKFNFIDTAGLRKTDDIVENIGIERTLQAAERADVILLVFDGGSIPKEYEEIKNNPKTVSIYNKADLVKHNQKDGISVSAKTGENVENLKQAIYDKIKADNVSNNDVLITNARHIDCLSRASQSLTAALDDKDNTLDCISLQIRESWQALGEITGTTASEDIVNRIFEKFCVGK